jgi:hypothetical protein
MARRPQPPPGQNPSGQNPSGGTDPTTTRGGAVVTTTGPAAGVAGSPHTPVIDPKSVTTAGQVKSPNVGPQYGGTQPSQDMNAAWGPVPVVTDGMTFWEIGQTGLRQFSGWVREEFLQTLVGRQGAQKYREMMDNNATIGGMLFAIQSTMRKVEWRVAPAESDGIKSGGNFSGAAQEQADFIDSCRHDMSQTFEDTIMENLSMLPFGFAVSELVYKKRQGKKPGMDRKTGRELPSSNYDDGKIGWRRMPGRSQDTIIKWFFDENGQTMGVTQQPWVGPLIDIPIEKMLLFRPTHYKNSPEGRSILRNSYVSYYYNKRLQEQEAILFERLGGIPVIKIPGQVLEAAAAGDSQALAAVQMYKKIAINLRTDEQMGIVLPSDMYPSPTGGATNAPMYSFELAAPQMARAGINMDTTISRYSVSMMTSVLADFLTLGHEARGTQSLAVTKVDLFMQAIEGYLNSMAGVYNRYAVPRLLDLNGTDLDLRPKLTPDLAQRVDLDVLSNFILRISQAGMPLFPDEDLQSYIKDAAGLPDIDDSRAMQAAGLTDDQLDLKDEQQEVGLDRMKNPQDYATAPPGGPGKGPGGLGGGGGGKGPPNKNPTQRTQGDQNRDNLEKMIRAAFAQRQVRLAGPRYGIVTKGHRHGLRRRKRVQAVNLHVGT